MARKIIRAVPEIDHRDMEVASLYVGPTRSIAEGMNVKDYIVAMFSPHVVKNMHKVLTFMIVRGIVCDQMRGIIQGEGVDISPPENLRQTKVFLQAFFISSYPRHSMVRKARVEDMILLGVASLVVEKFEAVLDAMRAVQPPPFKEFAEALQAYLLECAVWTQSDEAAFEDSLISSMESVDVAIQFNTVLGLPPSHETFMELHSEMVRLRERLRESGGDAVVAMADAQLSLRRSERD